VQKGGGNRVVFRTAFGYNGGNVNHTKLRIRI
jgi:hypothetical protein